MKDKNQIDQVFSSNLAGYEAIPPDGVFDNIVEYLRVPKRTKLKFFLRALAASIAIILSLSIGYWIGLNDKTNFSDTNTVFDQPLETNHTSNYRTNTLSKSKSDGVILAKKLEPSNLNSQNVSNGFNINNLQDIDYENDTSVMNTPFRQLIVFEKINSLSTKSQIDNQIIKPNNKLSNHLNFLVLNSEKKDFQTNSWEIGAKATPFALFSNSNGSGNNLNKYYHSSENQVYNYSFGAFVRKKLKKWIFESGFKINQSSINISNSYLLNNVAVNEFNTAENLYNLVILKNENNSNDYTFRNIELLSNNQVNAYISNGDFQSNDLEKIVNHNQQSRTNENESFNVVFNPEKPTQNTNNSLYNTINSSPIEVVTPDPITNDKTPTTTGEFNNNPSGSNEISNSQLIQVQSATVNQKKIFIEIPILLHYKLIQRKIQINVLGGVNFGIGVKNRVEIQSNQFSSTFDNSEYYHTLQIQGITGLSFEYKLTGNLKFLVQPVYKWHFRNIYSYSEFYSKPSSMGIFAGFAYQL